MDVLNPWSQETPQTNFDAAAGLPCAAAAELARALAPAGRKREVERGGRLFSFGEAALGVYVVVKGTARACLPGAPGRELFCHTAGPGTVLGLPSALCARSYQFDVEALEPVEAVFLETGLLNRILLQQPELCMQVMKMMCDEMSALKQTRDHMGACGKQSCSLHGTCGQAASSQ